MFNEDPQISNDASDTYKEFEAINIEQIDGKYQNFYYAEYAKSVSFKNIQDIKIKGRHGKCNYTGMVNGNNEPHGFGRAVDVNK